MATDGVRQRRPEEKKVNKKPRLGLSESEAIQKASKGWITHFIVALIGVVVILLAGVVILILLPSPIEPVEIIGLPEPPEFVGPLEPNNLLSNAEQVYRNQLSGPESVVVDGEHIYTGTADGWVNHIYQGVIQKLVRFGKGPCGGYENETTCGRPLGMRMDKNGFLIVADGYYGLFKVNVATGDATTLYSSNTPVNGKKSKLVNDLDIGADGKIYFTDSSTKWQRNNFDKILFEGVANGRFLEYDPSSGETTELVDGLFFPNGVQLIKDKSAVLVAETCRARILKYDLKTKKTTVWADNLPGVPDNIRYSKATGTYWVGLAFIREKGKFSLLDSLTPYPMLRGILSKILSINGLLKMKQYLQPTSVATMAVELNENGVITKSLQDKTGEVLSSVSEVEVADGVMYFGSFHSNYIGRLYRRRVPGL
ncbi:adipocyte plasma membrane-associated protein-like [Physella acuta]|uniref:adipocyte plasma membrane-associated protein-like n=1 Tax=Physella acuta TaxID=109671 RepID=UPI0027DC05E9|nr:adipocyte plasma membrane-associated protein-like [Physella acuta]XP_059157274.1 adipocyte plasma membrane-associated protein-like [Physella acuta]XP_059157275.1 adipocyte plasma membrane-associated protein-like [Physella acuta]